MSSTTFDLKAAKDAAAETDSGESKLAAGRLGNIVDRLIVKVMDNDDLDDRQKAAFLDSATGNVNVLFGARPTTPEPPAPAPVGSTKSTSSRSGDEDSDTDETLAKAQAEARVAKANVTKLVKAVETVLGSSLTFDPNSGELKSDVKAALQKVVTDAESAAVAPNSVETDTVAAKLDVILTGAKALSTNVVAGTKVHGKDELIKLVTDAKAELTS